MHWEILTIPLIALGVWIIGTLFKSEDEKTKKDGPVRGKIAGRPPGRRPVTNLDRFLEELPPPRGGRPSQRRPSRSPPRPPEARPPLREASSFSVPRETHWCGSAGARVERKRPSRPRSHDPSSRLQPSTRFDSTAYGQSRDAGRRSQDAARHNPLADFATGLFSVEQATDGRDCVRAARNI